jgi:hypothetical protein
MDGWGIIEGDLIQLEGETQKVRITYVDYDNNTITVDSNISWNQGQGVSLAYEGSAPDIGAYESKPVYNDDFHDNIDEGWTYSNGTWLVESGEYSGSVLSGAGISSVDSSITTHTTFIKADYYSNPDGFIRSGFMIFDHKGPNDFKYAGAREGTDYWAIGYYDGSWNDMSIYNETIDTLKWYSMRVDITGTTVTLYIDDYNDESGFIYKAEYTFTTMGSGQIGLAVDQSHAHFDNFEIYNFHTLTVLKAGRGSGTIKSFPAGIDCGTDCSEDYSYGTVVMLTTNYDDVSSIFAGWSGDIDCSNGMVTMYAARSCTATFDVCPNGPVRNMRTSLDYSAFQEAYDTAADGDTIQAQAVSFSEDLNINRDISITLEGGYDCNYSTIVGESKFNGKVTISNGTITIGKFVF